MAREIWVVERKIKDEWITFTSVYNERDGKLYVGKDIDEYRVVRYTPAGEKTEKP